MNIVFENHEIAVRENGSSEIFIAHKTEKRSEIRTTPVGNAFKVTCHNGTLIPSSSNGMPCFRAIPGKIEV